MNYNSSSAIIRATARKALKGNWQTALMITFLAGLFSTASQVLFTLRIDTVSSEMLSLVYNPDYASLGPAVEQLLRMLILPGVVVLVAGIVSPVLTMGQNLYFLKLLKGETAGYAVLLERFPVLLKSIWLSLLVGIRRLLWFVLGFIPMILVAWLLPSLVLQPLLYQLFLLFAIAMSVIANYRYILVMLILTDEPSLSAGAALRRGVAMMKGKTFNMLSLHISFFGWILLRSLLGTLLVSMVGSVVSMAIGLFLDLLLTVYMGMANIVYYNALKATSESTELFINRS